MCHVKSLNYVKYCFFLTLIFLALILMLQQLVQIEKGTYCAQRVYSSVLVGMVSGHWTQHQPSRECRSPHSSLPPSPRRPYRTRARAPKHHNTQHFLLLKQSLFCEFSFQTTLWVTQFSTNIQATAICIKMNIFISVHNITYGSVSPGRGKCLLNGIFF